VEGCTFFEINDKREFWDEIHGLVYALPKSKKCKPVDVSNTEDASSRLQQMPLQQSLQAAGSMGVHQAPSDWV